MQKINILLIALLAGLAIFSCKHTPPDVVIPEPPAGGGGGTGGTGNNLVCFESEILPIFQSNCAKSGCHDAASHNEGYVLDSYNNIIRDGIRPGRATNSKIYKVLFETGNDKMPPPPNPDLTAEQKALIGRWINEGALNTTNCSTGCDTLNFTFNSNIKPILINNCTGCHGGSAPDNNMDFTTYAGVRPVALNGKLLGAITHAPGFSPMPKNAAKLSDCHITQVRKWIEAGAQDN